MERLLDTILVLLRAVMLAMVLGRISRNEDVPLNVIRTDALSSAGIIFVALACGSLLRRKR